MRRPEKNKPLVFASIYPEFPDYFEDFFKAMELLALEDPALTIEPESSSCLGNGLRCGFLGELHCEVIRQRLLDEFRLKSVSTPPSVMYLLKLKDGSKEGVLIRHASEIKDIEGSYDIWE